MRYILIIIILSSCSANTHLKIAERHIAKAKMKGAKISSDTVYVDVVTSGSTTDTVYVLKEVDRIFHDTITIETERWKSRTRIDTLTKTIYQEVECKPDTIRVPYTVQTNIKADTSKHWQKYLLGFVAGIVLLALIFIFKR